jgi:hypothetical protein
MGIIHFDNGYTKGTKCFPLLSSRLGLVGRSASKCDMFIVVCSDIYDAYKVGINCSYFFPLQLNLHAIASNRSHSLTPTI